MGIVFLTCLLVSANPSTAQSTPRGRAVVELEDRLPRAALEPIGTLNFRGADLRDVLRAVAAESGLNLVVDDAVSGEVTVNLQDVTVIEAVRFLAEEYGLSLVQTGSIFRIRVPPPPEPDPPPAPREPVVAYADGRLTLDLDATPLRALARLVTERSGTNVVLGRGVAGAVTGFVQDAPLEVALRAVLAGAGFELAREGGVLVIRATAPDGAPTRVRGSREVSVAGGRISLRLQDADVGAAVREIARQAGAGVVTYTVPEGRTVSVSADGLSLEQALRVVLRGTGAAFRVEDGLVLVGTAEADGLVATRLLRLGYVSVEDVLDLVPERILERARVDVIPEQNALLVSGPNEAVAELAAFLGEIDHPAPQVLIETLVVDLLDTDASELGFDFGRGTLPGTDAAVQPRDYDFDGTGSGVLRATGSGEDVNYALDRLDDTFGLGGIGRLPADFYYRVRALEREGRIHVRSRPQVATLSGNTATISIGTTQYFLLETSTPISSRDDVFVQETQRFEQIEANVSLEITPYVSPRGEVTALIKPTFATPVGDLQPDVPPTIATREIESLVRLRDGETIILGGLIEDSEVEDVNKIPILGDIPLLGRLFQSRTRIAQRSELVIYLTPHVFYGDGRDLPRARALADSLDLRYSPLNPSPSFWDRIWPFGEDEPYEEPQDAGGVGSESEDVQPGDARPAPGEMDGSPPSQNGRGEQPTKSESAPRVTPDLPPLDLGPLEQRPDSTLRSGDRPSGAPDQERPW